MRPSGHFPRPYAGGGTQGYELMKHIGASSTRRRQYQMAQRIRSSGRPQRQARPPLTYRQRGIEGGRQSQDFAAPEAWYEPQERTEVGSRVRYVVEQPGRSYVHPVSIDEVRERLEMLPARFRTQLEVVQFSRMTRKRALFPCYGLQWGTTVYLYPIEDDFQEKYARPPHPQQLIEARMFGGKWTQNGNLWTLQWTAETIRDFYLNNVLVHEVGHIFDDRNTSFEARERFANWFAIEYGYRASRRRR
jgi:hypothetical protein